MTVIKVNIDRLILEGVDLSSAGRQTMRESLEAAIRDRLSEATWRGATGRSLASVAGGVVSIAEPRLMGTNIGHAVSDSFFRACSSSTGPRPSDARRPPAVVRTER